MAFTLIAAEGFASGRLKTGPILWIIAGTGLINSVMAIAQSFDWDPIFGIPIEEIGRTFTSGRRKVMGFLGNPVFVSEFISASLPFVVGLFLTRRSKAKRVVLGVIMLAYVMAVLASMTRSSAISVILSFGVFLVIIGLISRGTGRLRPMKRALFFLFLGTALVYALALLHYNPISQRYSEQGSLDKRFSMWSNTWSMVRESPILGRGLGSFKLLYFDSQASENLKKMQAVPPKEIPPSPRGGLAHAHNEYLQIAQETGALGFLTFVFLVASLFVLGISVFRRAIKQTPSPETENLCIIVAAAMTSIVSILTSALTGFPFHITSTATIGLVGVAVVLGLSQRALRSERNNCVELSTRAPRAFSGRWSVRIVTVIVLLLGMVSCLWPIKLMFADYHTYIGDRLRKRAYLDAAMKQYELARRFSPNDGRLLSKMGLTRSTMSFYTEADALYDEAAELFSAPSHVVSAAENDLRLGQIYDAIGGFTRALAYTQMPKYRHRLGEIYCSLAGRYVERGQFAMAIGCLDEARRIDSSVHTLKLAAELQELRGTTRDAIDTLREILRQDRFEIAAAFRLGELEQARGNLIGAREAFEAVRGLDPDYRNVGKHLLEIALTLTNRTTAPLWERSKDLFFMGKLALEYGQFQQALMLFKKLEQITSEMPQVHLFLGQAYEKRDDTTEAEKEYWLAQSLDPTDARPLINLFDLYTREDDYDGIEEVRKKVDSFSAEYEYKEVIRSSEQSPIVIVDPGHSRREIFRGISLDELSTKWEDRFPVTAVWDNVPMRPVGPRRVTLIEDRSTAMLRSGGRSVFVTQIANLIRGKNVFHFQEGAPQLAGASDGLPTFVAGPNTVVMRTSDRVARTVFASQRMPVDPATSYLLFAKCWVSKERTAYLIKQFLDRDGNEIFFNRYPAGEQRGDWKYIVDYVTPPPRAKYVVLFLVLESPSSTVCFDNIVLAPLLRPGDVVTAIESRKLSE